MEAEVIIRGSVSTKDPKKFINEFNDLLKNTNSTFSGQSFVYEFDDAEIIEDEET